MNKEHKRKGADLYGVPVYETEEFTYILFNEVPVEHKAEFGDWMYGQTGAVINGDFVVYSWDWERWYEMKFKGTPTYFD
jgi:hypothetical protein